MKQNSSNYQHIKLYLFRYKILSKNTSNRNQEESKGTTQKGTRGGPLVGPANAYVGADRCPPDASRPDYRSLSFYTLSTNIRAISNHLRIFFRTDPAQSLGFFLILSPENPYKYVPRPPSIVSHKQPPRSSEKLSNLNLLAMADKAIISYSADFNNIPNDDSKALILSLLCHRSKSLWCPNVMSKDTTHKIHLLFLHLLQGCYLKRVLRGSKLLSRRVLRFFHRETMNGSCWSKPTRRKAGIRQVHHCSTCYPRSSCKP